LEVLVPGETVSTEHGPFYLRRTYLPLDTTYGPCRLGDFLDLRAGSAAALARAPELGAVSLERTLFLDTETTGLAGGTGTYAFLIGLGRFQEHGSPGAPCFVLEQGIMRTYGEERAMLSWVAGLLEEAEVLVTFNGRGFDLPLLQTRFLMSRMRLDLEEWPHFDLLPPARRLWRPAYGSCALQSLERHVLGVGREADVESFLIPAIFHQFLRDGDARYLQRVFNHNQADVLAMVAVAVRACLVFDDGLNGAVPSAECLGLGRVYEEMGDLDAAEAAYHAVLRGARGPEEARPEEARLEVRGRALQALALLLKRRRRHEDAAAVWERLVAEAPAHSVVALVELSKYWEHRRRDPRRARDYASLAHQRWLATLAAGGPSPHRALPGMRAWEPAPSASRAPDDFSRRLARLEQKQARAAG
ncbi:MAG TPA: ribonuclease H-like domain-containing protein, partial [Chloroflexota bacterium]|nr:ribonuclease H-like domain-containing protein [Chloroflexota bacterium]